MISMANNKDASGFAPAGITEHPPPPDGGGEASAVPEMTACVGVPPPDRLTVAVPEYAPTATGVMVTVTPHVAPAASMALLQLSTEVAMIAGVDSDTTPTRTAVAFGLPKVRSTAVDPPTYTVVAVTVGAEIVSGDPPMPLSPTAVFTPGALVGTDNVAEWLPDAVGM